MKVEIQPVVCPNQEGQERIAASDLLVLLKSSFATFLMKGQMDKNQKLQKDRAKRK